jgi:hypothetical protein
MNMMEKQLKSKCINLDYYKVSLFSVIGADVKSNTITVINADSQLNIAAPLYFNIDSVRDYKAYAPGYSDIDIIGNISTLDKHSVLTKNINSKSKASVETGLYFYLDNIYMPQVFVRMEYSDAEKWMLIVSKMLNNTIEHQPTPMQYPQQ